MKKLLTPHQLAGILETAAAASPEPVHAHELLDPAMQMRGHRLRAHINSIVCYHLLRERGEHIHRIASMYKAHRDTIHSRCTRGECLRKQQPWKRIHQALNAS